MGSSATGTVKVAILMAAELGPMIFWLCCKRSYLRPVGLHPRKENNPDLQVSPVFHWKCKAVPALWEHPTQNCYLPACLCARLMGVVPDAAPNIESLCLVVQNTLINWHRSCSKWHLSHYNFQFLALQLHTKPMTPSTFAAFCVQKCQKHFQYWRGFLICSFNWNF